MRFNVPKQLSYKTKLNNHANDCDRCSSRGSDFEQQDVYPANLLQTNELNVVFALPLK